tara:strand:- start:19740 stop:21488 length:1749 start_codon:yes stop_codon:yes gene_type:complete
VSCSSGHHKNSEVNFDKTLDSIGEEVSEKIEKSAPAFVDQAREFGLENIEAYNFNVVDLNGDDYSDIVVIPSFYSQPVFYYYNIFEKKFIKGESPFDSPIKASYLLFYDLNKDNILDVIVGVLNQKTELSTEPFRIFYGEKNKLNELSFKPSSHKFDSYPNSSVGLIDYDLDGDLDLYIGNWFFRYKGNPIPHKDFLFENKKDKYFDVTELLIGENKQTEFETMHVNATPTYSVQICDMDQNGYPDVLTTSTNSYRNNLWINSYKFREQKRYFANAGISSGFAADPEGLLNTQGGGRTFGLACADYNNDGIMDVFLGELTHNYDHQGIDRSSILTGRTLKNHPRFYRTEYTQDSFDPNWHQADRRALWLDFNNDGLLDLIIDNSGYPPYSKMIVFRQLPDHSFMSVSDELGLNILNPIATVMLDVNRDGKMDILTAQTSIRDEKIKPRLYLMVNKLDVGENRSLRFFLRGQNSNYHGLNATVILKTRSETDSRFQKQVVSYSYGALPPQNEEGIHFGIPANEKIEYVKVIWPYAKEKNQGRIHMEKVYKLSDEFDSFLNITLCENGDFLIGRRECFASYSSE